MKKKSLNFGLIPNRKRSFVSALSIPLLLVLAPAILVLLIAYSSFFKNQTQTYAQGTFESTVCSVKLDPSGQSQCGSEVGNPFDYRFCDTWAGGFCDDFRTYQNTMMQPFPSVNDPISVDAMSTTGPQYYPDDSASWQPCCNNGVVPPSPGMYVFAANEHMMTSMIDSNFGDIVFRIKQPFDFAGRTGHIHFDVDLKTSARRYIRLTLTPSLEKRGPDDRNPGSLLYPLNANTLDIWFKGGTIFGTLAKNGSCGSFNGGYCVGNLFEAGGITGFDNVRNHIDVYISRTHIKIQIEGITYVDQNIPDIGFDRAYVYLQQTSYNACKDGTGAPDTQTEVWPGTPLDQCSIQAQEFHWDDFAFDGPVLPQNSLTPLGYEDVIFNAYSVGNPGVPGDCKVKGVAASPVTQALAYTWISWLARLPANTPVSTSDIVCSYSFVTQGSDVPRGLEIVQQGQAVPVPSGTTNPTPTPMTVMPPTPTPTPTPVSKPTVGLRITSPASGQTVSGTVNVLAQAVNSSGVNQVNFLVDGKSIGTDTTSPFNISWNTAGYTNGSHTITVNSVDIPGYTASVTVNVSNNVSSPSVFGYSTVGSQTDTGDSNFMNGSMFVTSNTAKSIKSISVFVDAVDSAPNNQYQVAVYSDSNGTPGTLIAKSSTGTLSANSWNTLPISATLNANTAYWLMYNTNGTTSSSNNMRFDTGGTDAYGSSNVAFGTWPTTFGSAVLGNLNFSIYATYGTGTPSVTPTPTTPPAPTSTPIPTKAPTSGSAAFSLVPSSQTVTVNTAFSVMVHVNTLSTQPINAVEPVISYPASLVKVVSFNNNAMSTPFGTPYKEINDPSTGTITIVSGSPAPVTGDNHIVTINFQTLSTPGQATISFSSKSQVVSSVTNAPLNLLSSPIVVSIQ